MLPTIGFPMLHTVYATAPPRIAEPAAEQIQNHSVQSRLLLSATGGLMRFIVERLPQGTGRPDYSRRTWIDRTRACHTDDPTALTRGYSGPAAHIPLGLRSRVSVSAGLLSGVEGGANNVENVATSNSDYSGHSGPSQSSREPQEATAGLITRHRPPRFDDRPTTLDVLCLAIGLPHAFSLQPMWPVQQRRGPTGAR